MLAIEVLRTVIPYRNLDHVWRYYHHVESLADKRQSFDDNHHHLLLLLLLYVYFVLNFVWKLFGWHLSPLDRFLQADLVFTFYNEYFYAVPIMLALLNMYFVYIMYIVPDCRVLARQRKILEHSRRLRRIAHAETIVLTIFTVIVDSAIIYWHVGYFRIAWEQHYDRLFSCGVRGYARLAFHLFNSLLTDLILLNYTHLCILIMTLVVPILIHLMRRQSFASKLLRSSCRLSWSTQRLASFIRLDSLNFRIVFTFDRFYGRIFFAFLLFSCPLNAFLAIQACLGHFHGAITLATVFALIWHQVNCVFAVHLALASFVKRAHAPAKVLLNMAARTLRQAGRLRAKITLDGAIARLNAKKTYGFTYGSIAQINMSTFFKFLLLYGKFLIFSYKIIRRSEKNLAP